MSSLVEIAYVFPCENLIWSEHLSLNLHISILTSNFQVRWSITKSTFFFSYLDECGREYWYSCFLFSCLILDNSLLPILFLKIVCMSKQADIELKDHGSQVRGNERSSSFMLSQILTYFIYISWICVARQMILKDLRALLFYDCLYSLHISHPN